MIEIVNWKVCISSVYFGFSFMVFFYSRFFCICFVYRFVFLVGGYYFLFFCKRGLDMVVLGDFMVFLG